MDETVKKEESKKQSFIEAVNKELDAIKVRRKELRDAIAYNDDMGNLELKKQYEQEQDELIYREIVLLELLSYQTFKAISNLTEEQKAVLIRKRVESKREEIRKKESKIEELQNPPELSKVPEGYSEWNDEKRERHKKKVEAALKSARDDNYYKIEGIKIEISRLTKEIEELEGPNAQKIFLGSFLEERTKGDGPTASTVFDSLQYLPMGKSLELARIFYNNPEFTKNIVEFYKQLYSSRIRANNALFENDPNLRDFVALGAFRFTYEGKPFDNEAMARAVREYFGIGEVTNYEGIKVRADMLTSKVNRLEAIKQSKLEGIRRAREVASHIIQDGFTYSGAAEGTEADRKVRALMQRMITEVEYIKAYYAQKGIDPKEKLKQLYVDDDGIEISEDVLLDRYIKAQRECSKASRKNIFIKESTRQDRIYEANSKMYKILEIIRNGRNRINFEIRENILPEVIEKSIGTSVLGQYDYIKGLETEEGTIEFEKRVKKVYDSIIANLTTSVTEDKAKADKLTKEVKVPTEEAICGAIGSRIDLKGEDLVQLGERTLSTLFGGYDTMIRSESGQPNPNIAGREIALGQLFSEDTLIGIAVRDEVTYGKPTVRYDEESGQMVPIEPEVEAPKTK